MMTVVDANKDPELGELMADIAIQLELHQREDSDAVRSAIFSMLNMGEYEQAAHYLGGTAQEAQALYEKHFPEDVEQGNPVPAPGEPAVGAYEAERDAFLVAAGFHHGWENLESCARRMVEHALAERAAQRALAIQSQPLAWLKRGELEALRFANGMSLWAEGPSMYQPACDAVAPVEFVPVFGAPSAQVQLDAARWNAFINCKHVRMFGWAGAGLSEDDKRAPGDNYVHFGGEFWTVHPVGTAPEMAERNVRVLTAFADASLAEKANPTVFSLGA